MSDTGDDQWYDLPLPDLSATQRQGLHDSLRGEGIPASWGGSTIRVDAAHRARLDTLVAQVRSGTPGAPGPAPSPPAWAPPPPAGAGTGAPAPPPGWPAGPTPATPYVPGARTNSMATLSLILGICSLLLCAVTGPFAIWAGLRARREIRRTGEQGDGMAVAGAITGAIGTAFLLLAVLFLATLIVIAAAN